MKAFSWKVMLLSVIEIILSVFIFLMLLSYLRDMISVTAGLRAFISLALILGLGLAELAFTFLIGAHFNACAKKGKLQVCFLSTSAVLGLMCSFIFYLRYILLVHILGRELSFETIGAVSLLYPVLFMISMTASSTLISLRLFQPNNK